MTFTLVGANGNFPYLVSVFNAQAVITPKDYVGGHHPRQGPGRHRAVQAATATTSHPGAKFARNDAWWGGKTPLDGSEFTFFDDTGSMVTAYQGGSVDALVQFDVLSGASLFTDAKFNASRRRPPTTGRSGCAATRVSSRTSGSARHSP